MGDVLASIIGVGGPVNCGAATAGPVGKDGEAAKAQRVNAVGALRVRLWNACPHVERAGWCRGCWSPYCNRIAGNFVAVSNVGQ